MHHPAKRAAKRRVLAAWVAVLAGLGFGTAMAETPARGLKALVHDSEAGTVRTLESLGARRVAQRGSLLVYELAPNRATEAAALPGVVVRPDFDSVRLNRRTVDTINPGASRSAGVYAPADFQRPLKLVQFAAPPTQADLDELSAKGARIVHYVPQNAYIVWTDNAAPLVHMERDGKLQFVADLHPDDSVSPRLDEAARAGAEMPVTIQLFAGADSAKADLAIIESVAGGVIEPAREALGGKYINVTVRMAAEALPQVASLGSTIWVEEFIEPELFDERQGIIMAGEISAAGAPNAPGYLDWIDSKNFPQTPASYPLVVVVDDGVDNGTTTPANSEFREYNNAGNPSRIIFASVPPGSAAGSAEGPDGHGNINASIVAGYNAGTGSAVEDAAGFNYGLGISPYGRVANSRIFAPGFDIGSGTATLVADHYQDGARISTNSWGSSAAGAYTTRSQEYDLVVRDADPGAVGNQELSVLFAAGNDGSGANSIGAPGTGKNITTVGASETSNPAATAGDGCALVGSDGDTAQDIAGFSSRGPTDDGRRKPDIVAPGTFIQGAASQPVFNGSGVCGAASNDFGGSGADALFPPSSAYTWSSGTSHSTPAVAGYKQLIWEFLGREYGVSAPSPALLKAYVIHSGTQISGAGDELGGNNQGFGLANMATGFSTAAPRVFVNQETVFTEPGETVSLLGSVANPSEPVRIAMVFTDTPGATSGAAYVNDLDLTVTYNGETYFGNQLSGGESVTGGAPDPMNNVEVVFLPPGAGQLTINVGATTLAGDGVPGTGDATDQDFALVVYNFSQEPTPALIGTGNNSFDDNGIGNADGILDPGESGVDVNIEVKNGGTLGATGVAGRLVSLTPTALVTQADATYGDLDIDAMATNSLPFEISLSADHPCGAPVLLRLELTSNETVGNVRLSFPTGQPGTLDTETTASTNVPITINDSTIHQSTLDIALTGPVTDVNVRGLNITHTYTGDLDISLRSPAGTVVDLSSDNGGTGENFTGTDFDDAASASITGGTAPFTGAFRPEGSLAAFNGEDAAGTWTLVVADDASGDTGTLTAWSLEVVSQEIVCTAAAAPQFDDAGGASFDDTTGNGNGDGIMDPGEDTILFTLPIENIGAGGATNCTATLVSLTDRLTVVDGTASYGDIAAGNTASNATPFTVALNGGHPCGEPVRMRLNVTSDEGFGFVEYEFATGNNLGSGTQTVPAAALPAPIADSTTAESTVSVAASGTVTGVRVVGMDITHTYCGDVDLSLRSPSGTVIVLSTDNGGGEDNYTGTTFDDAAATAITGGAAPFTGSFRPEEPLATFIGESVNGDWTLIYGDDAADDTGTLNAWSLEVSYEEIACAQITLPSVAFETASSTTTERDGNFAVDVALDFATIGVDGTVDYLVTGGSAVFGTDHSLTSGTLTFPAGTETASIAVPLLNDFVEDGDQTLEISLSNPANVILSASGATSHTLTMTDNDPKPTPTETPVPTPSATPSPSATESPTPTPAPDGVFCSTDGPIAVPDEDPAGVSSTIVVTDTRVISDLNVDLNLTHTFVGDFIMTLTHVESGTSVELMNRPGVPASEFGCGTNNVDATMDDEGTAAVEGFCAAAPPGLGGNLIPDNPLSAFDGMSAAGTWTISCSDNAPQDTGTLDSWCLVATFGDIPTATPTDAPTATPADTPTATVTPTATDAPTPTDRPTEAPTATPSATEEPTPTDRPTDAPTATPTDAVTATPTDEPTATPTDRPTDAPTASPTDRPTDAPTATPTDAPTATATDAPTATPTDAPTATPTDAPTASPTAEPTPTATPDDDFTFDETDEDWSFFPGQNLGSENGAYTTGTLRITSGAGTGDFGFWESQELPLPTQNTPAGSQSIAAYNARYVVSTDQAVAADVPTIRLRATASNAAQADVLAIESVGNGEYSPTSGEARSYDLLFTAAQGTNSARLAFDLLNFDGFGAPGSSIVLDRVTLTAVSLPDNTGTLEGEWTDFSAGWEYRTVASGFVSPTGALAGGKPTITSVPFSKGGPTVQFGWWNGPETAEAGAITVQPDRLYWVEAEVSTNAKTPDVIPSFRIRLNESGFRAGKLIQVASNFDESRGETGAQNVPPIGGSAAYRAYLPAGLPAGGVLFPSFDMLTTAADNDSAGITVTLESLRVYSTPIAD